MRKKIHLLSCNRCELAEGQRVIEYDCPEFRRAKKILEIVVRDDEFLVLLLVLTIQGSQFFIDRFELLVATLQFFIRGNQFFIGRLKFLVGSLKLLNRSLKMIAGAMEIILEILDALHRSFIRIERFTYRGG